MNHKEEARATEHEPRRQAQPSRSGDWLEYQEGEAFQLSPVDRGRDAWTVLIAGIVFEALFWGFPMCFGVFQNYYADMHELTGNAANIPLIGTLAQGLYYLGAPFSAFLATKYPKYQRRQIWAGWPLCIAGLVAASFTTSVHGLIGTQGLLYGFGFVTLSYPIVSMLNEWWVARKGMAFGLISASSGLTGAFMPSIVELLLRTYGYRTTLRACAVALAVLTGPLVPLFRSRLPASEHARLRRVNWGFLHRPLFWVYGAATLVQGLGFYLPVVFLPSYATSLDISSARGALLLALMSVAQVLGQFTFGYLSDKKVSVGLLSCVCCIAAGTASLSLWGRGTSLGLLAVFSLIYGFFGFGFGTMRVAMARAIDNDPSAVFALFAIFVSLQGIGNILVGPMSMALLAGPVLRGRFGVKHYAGLIILTGVSSLFAALVIAGWHGYKRKVILRSN